MSGRWNDYVLAGDLAGMSPPEELWLAAVKPELKTLWLMGVGFDPRSLIGLQRALSTLDTSRLEVCVVELPPPSASADPRARSLAADNAEGFSSLTSNLAVRVVPYPPVQDSVNAGPTIARVLTRPESLDGVGSVILDISSMPSNVYFPLIAAFLTVSDLPTGDQRHFGGEFSVVACDNAAIDAIISEQGVDSATVVGGFRRLMPHGVAPSDSGPVVWAPVIGEACGPALDAVHELLAPADTTPVLPFPSRDPRRADRLVLAHQVELFDKFQVSTSNIIYANESNPFDLYRTLRRVSRGYRYALGPLGDTTVAISAHSSKLLSLGAVLAAYEDRLPIVAAQARDYVIDANADLDVLSADNHLISTWLAGEPFHDTAIN